MGMQTIEPTIESETPRIIVIDDIPAIHQDFRKILGQRDVEDSELESLESAIFGIESQRQVASRGYDLTSAFSGEEGARLVREAIAEGRPFSTAIVDMRMPTGWDGIETIRQLWEVDPDLQILICTAYVDHTWPDIVAKFGHHDQLLILRKPFDAADVCQIAAAMTEKRRLTSWYKDTVSDLEGVIERKTETLRSELRRREELQQRLLDREKQVGALQKMEAIGIFAGGVAHEFNNLLQIILTHTEFACEASNKNETLRSDLSNIRAAAERASSLTQQLLGFSDRKPLRCRDIDVNMIIRELADMASPLLGNRINLRSLLSQQPIVVSADPTEIQRVLLNCCINARDAMDGAGELTLRTESVDLDASDCESVQGLTPGQYASIQIEDNGKGIPEEFLGRVFDPYFTTKETGSSSGLGLSMVYGLVKQHAGLVRLDSTVGKGTQVEILLPVVTQIQQENEPAQTETRPDGNRQTTDSMTVLYVDDEESLRHAGQRILESAGYHVITARDGQEAIAIVENDHESIDLVLLDDVMPNLTGSKTFERIKHLRPDLPVVFCTAHDPKDNSSPDAGATQVLYKPFAADQLLASVKQTLC